MTKHHASVKIEDFLVFDESRNYKDHTDALEAYIKKLESHFRKPKTEEEGGDEVAELGPIGYVPDLLAD